MSANPTDGGTTPPKSGGRPPKSWAGRSRMKLVGALRGKGALLVAERTVPATYEMDVFDMGAMRTLSGQLRGDFSRLAGAEAQSARLRLEDGREIEINLVAVRPNVADFDGRGPTAGSELFT